MGTRYFGGLSLLLCMGSLCFGVTGVTNSEDASALNIMMLLWENSAPSNWNSDTDPCDSHWDGVTCTDGRITSLKLSSVGLKGALSEKIGSLTALQLLDLSYNDDLAGNLPSSIGNLVSLKILIVIGCNFNGNLPSELGNLTNLSFLALNSNKFTGPIPTTLGKLTNLEWLDLADNQLTGSLPVSSATQSGLDKLVNAQHFHFNLNKLSGTIPPELFSENMKLLHILFDSNDFHGRIPPTLGLVVNLIVVRLDRNQITGSIPSNISNLLSLEELNLSNNRLNGDIPNLSALDNLYYLDLSNNSYNSLKLPPWLTNLQKLTTIVMENCSLAGQISSTIFNLPALETVRMKNNQLNGTVKIDISNSKEVQWIDLRNNDITEADFQGNTASSLWIAGNPACNPGTSLSSTKSCQHIDSEESYETNMAQCGDTKCSGKLKPNPTTCKCQQPYEGLLKFRALSFSDLKDTQRFKSLEHSLKNNLAVDAVHLCCFYFDSADYLIISVQFFPVDTKLFTQSEALQIGYNLSQQLYRPPDGFGPYFFTATSYIIGAKESSKGLSLGIIVGIAFGAFILALVVMIIGLYTLWQKKRAERAIEIHKPFASWGASSMDGGNTPRLKGARWFSFAEIKKATNNFSESNEIGSGGYGRVYKALLPEGEMVAIKRAHQRSLQGEGEFKNEIELLSRVHHKNLVGLIGFCAEEAEQLLIYEYMPNGTLRENLIGQFTLDWARRLQIALGSAKGLNYLHELANPPIIHRDVKSCNILLDENLNPKVTDFGLSKLVADGGVDAGSKTHVTTQIKGTPGYLDPEYCRTEQLSTKSDVYSFGIVLLELITARLPIEGGKYIVVLVNNALANGGIACLQEKLMDPVLRQDNLTGFGEFLGLALSCLKESGTERPTMREVVKELESIVDMQGSFHSIKDSPQSGPTGVKGIRKLYGEDEEGISIVLPGQGKEERESLFEYSGAYQVSGTIQPK